MIDQPRMPHKWLTNRVYWVIDRIILVLAVLAVPFTHGLLEYVGLVLFGILLVALNHVVERKNRRVPTT